MNIFLTIHQFLPEFFSGTEILTLSVAKELIKRGHQVFVFTGFPAREHRTDDKRFDEYNFEDIRICRFYHAYVPMGTQAVITEIEYDNQLVSRFFAQQLSRLKPDVVHFFHLSRLGVGLIDAVAAFGIPAYYTPTDFWSVCPTSQLRLENGRPCSGPTRFGGNCIKHVVSRNGPPTLSALAKFAPATAADVLAKLVVGGLLPRHPYIREIAALAKRRSFNVTRLNNLQGIFSPTQLMTEVLVANGVHRSLIAQSHYGIDLTGYSGQSRRLPRAGPITFGFVGTLASHKGCHVLIDAFKKVAADGAKLLIYGDPTHFPEYVASLRRQATDARSIEFCGTFANSRIAEVMAGLDVLVVPSIWYENTPLVIYSAMAAKCPVVCSDFPGMTEVVHDGINGLAFPPGHVQALGNCLTRLIKEPNLLENLRANCLQPRSTAEYVDDLLALYGQQLRRGKPLQGAPISE